MTYRAFDYRMGKRVVRKTTIVEYKRDGDHAADKTVETTEEWVVPWSDRDEEILNSGPKQQ